MKKAPRHSLSRRAFLKDTGRIAAASAVAFSAIPGAYAGEDNTIRVALIGCGGRGSGAVVDALSPENGPVRLVAMADAFENRLKSSYKALIELHPDQIDVPEDRRFVGLDAYRDAMDALRPGDIAILASPPAFRWVHFKYAIDRGLHVFMEKPVTVDGPTSLRMIELADAADAKNLKVGVGLMVRHCRGRMELKERIDGGQIGDILMMRAYRMHGPAGFCFSEPAPADMSEMMYQIQRFHSFLWASGGLYSDFYIHQIDECCWMKGAWPTHAQATGGRHYRGSYVDQNFDNYSVEYTFGDGTKLFVYGRTIEGCYRDMSSYAHGTNGTASVSTNGHAPGRVRIFRGHDTQTTEPTWAFPQPEPNPYKMEWVDLVDAIRNDKPFNEVKRGVKASLVTSMGRMAAHTGRVVTLDEMTACDHEFAPGLDALREDSPAPLLADAGGRYPVPEPGVKLDREY
jgi:predicted dehydrogenase